MTEGAAGAAACVARAAAPAAAPKDEMFSGDDI